MTHLDDITHMAYSDESSYNDNRYRSIGMVSLKSQILVDCHKKLEDILKDSSLKEFKWNKLKDARMRHGAIKLIDFALENMSKGNMRIDILTWDTQDVRHAVQGRDDSSNLVRMYYHLLRWVLTEKWGDKTKWAIHPDEHSSINWPEIEEFLGHKSVSSGDSDLFRDIDYLREHFEIIIMHECQSIEYPIIQIADLFAGMGQHSWNDFSTYNVWKRGNSEQMCFDEILGEAKISNRKKEQWSCIDYLKKKCNECIWGVSLTSSKGFRTRNHLIGPLNYWLYVPQHESDRAPIKSKGF